MRRDFATETFEEHAEAVERHMSGPYSWYRTGGGIALALANEEEMLERAWRLGCVWKDSENTYIGVFMMSPTIPSFYTGEGFLATVTSTEAAMTLLEREHDLALGKTRR